MIGIYKITNKCNNKVYIGQSVDIEKRWKEHLSKVGKKPNAIYKAMEKYGVENFIFEVVELCPVQQLNEKEEYWIKHFDSYKNGYNMTLGGDANRKYDPKYLVEQYKIYGTAEETAKHCGCHYHTVNRALRTEQVPNNANSSGYSRPIKQIDPNTLKVIQTFPNVISAAKAMGAKQGSMISKALSGVTEVAYGYIWKDINFDETTLQKPKIKKMHTNQQLQQYDLTTGEVINTFNNAKEALLFLRKDPKNGGIYRAASGQRKSFAGFGWKYIDRKEN